MIIDYPWYMVLLCLLAGAAYAAVLYFTGRRRFPRRTQWLLTALRFLAVSVIAFLLLAPMTRRTVHDRQKPHVLVAVDRSLSVLQSDDSAFSAETLTEAFGDRLRFSLMPFGDAAGTDIGSVLQGVEGDVDAVVLATDGIANRGPNPATAAERLTVPVYTVALGDTTPRRDAALGTLRVARVVMSGSTIPVEITVTATLLSGRSAQYSIADAHGRTLISQRIAYDDDRFAQTVTASLPAAAPGLQRFVASLTVLEGEVSASNNTVSFFVDVIDARRKVAIVADAPHPDLAALRRAIGNNPNYEADVFFASDLRRWKKEDYSLVILHNLPSREHPDVAFAKDMAQMYVVGLHTDLARFNALHTGVEITAKASRTNEVTAIAREGFALFNYNAADAAAFEELPPLSAPFGEARVAEGVQTLFGARLGSIDTRQPLVAATAQGEHRRVVVWGEGLWRWRLADFAAASSHDRFDRLVQQMVAFAAMQADRQRLRVEAERTYQAGIPALLRAQLYNEAYEPVNNAEVSLELKGDSLDGTFLFQRDGDGYSLTLPNLREGVYRYRASTADGLTADGTFAVESTGVEMSRLVADHSLLRTISHTTGGEMFAPADIDLLKRKLAELKPTIYSHTRYSDLLGLPWVLALIVLLLGAEWLTRKLGGEI